MWPFTKKVEIKKEQVAEPKKKKILHRELIKVNIGYTLINLTFLDGRHFITTLYGTTNEHIDWSTETSYKRFFSSSLEEAQLFIQRQGSHENTYVNDYKNIKSSIYGRVIHCEILDTFMYEIEVTDYSFKEEN